MDDLDGRHADPSTHPSILMPVSPSLRILLLGALLFVAACGSDTTVVESGTYEGTITDVNASEREIYVEVPGTGTLELYFTDGTRVVRDTMEASFDDLTVDQPVAVEVEKVGQRLDPIRVEIQE